MIKINENAKITRANRPKLKKTSSDKYITTKKWGQTQSHEDMANKSGDEHLRQKIVVKMATKKGSKEWG